MCLRASYREWMSVRILNYKRFRILIPNYGKIGTMPFRFDESHISMGAWENVLEISDGDWMWQKEREREWESRCRCILNSLSFDLSFDFTCTDSLSDSRSCSIIFHHVSCRVVFFPDPIASFHGFCFKCDRSTRHYRRKCGRFKCSTRLVGNLFQQEWY